VYKLHGRFVRAAGVAAHPSNAFVLGERLLANLPHIKGSGVAVTSINVFKKKVKIAARNSSRQLGESSLNASQILGVLV